MTKLFATALTLLAISCGGLSDAQEHYNKGAELSGDGQYAEAVDEYTRALELDDELVDAYINRGNAYINLAQYEAAVADLDSAIALDHENTIALVNRGAALILVGDQDAGIADLETAIGLDISLCVTMPPDTAQLASCPPADEVAELNDQPDLPGAYIPPHPGSDGIPGTRDDRIHLGEGVSIPICTEAQIEVNQGSSPLCYTSNPPTSGPHGAAPMPFTVLEDPAPKENLVHNMEHGGVVIWYNTTDQDIINQLETIVADQNSRRRLVVLTSYSEMETSTVALTAWTRLDKFPISDFTAQRVEDFIAEHHKRFNPEGF